MITDIEQQAASDNSLLQLQGANQMMAKASKAIGAALTLGGESDAISAEINLAFNSARDLLRLVVAAGYRHKAPFDYMANKLGIEDKEVLRFLGEHFTEHPQIAHEWLAAATARMAKLKE